MMKNVQKHNIFPPYDLKVLEFQYLFYNVFQNFDF